MEAKLHLSPIKSETAQRQFTESLHTYKQSEAESHPSLHESEAVMSLFTKSMRVVFALFILAIAVFVISGIF